VPSEGRVRSRLLQLRVDLLVALHFDSRCFQATNLARRVAEGPAPLLTTNDEESQGVLQILGL
jgi:hypothetical protein